MKASIAKLIKWIIVILLLVILAVALIINFAGNTIVKNAIEYGGTRALDVAVEVQEADLSLLKAKFTISDLIVANPPGFETDTMLELGNMTIDSSYGELLADPAVIEEIVLDDIQITLEQKGLTNNIQEVLKNVSKKTPQEQTEKEGKKVVIKRLEIKGAVVNAKLLPIGGKEQTVKFKLEPIILENIGTDEPVNVATVSAKVLTALVAGIIKQGGGLLPDDITGALGGTLDSAVEVLDTGVEAGKKILESGKDLGEGVGDTIKGTGEGVKEGIEGIFKPKKQEEN